MSRSVHINLELLKAVVKSEQKLRISILSVADKSLVTAICECALNVLNGNIKLTSKVRKALFKERDTIRLLAKSDLNVWKYTRNVIVRKSKTLVPLLVRLALAHLAEQDYSRGDEIPYVREPATIPSHPPKDHDIKVNSQLKLLDHNSSSHHFLSESTGIIGNGKNKRRARRVCKLCYDKSSKENDGVRYKNMNKVSTFCSKCPKQPYMCTDCFKESHSRAKFHL